MEHDYDYSGEFILDSDEGSPLPLMGFGDDSDTLTLIDASHAAASKLPYPTPTISHSDVPHTIVSPQSLPESGDSLSGSSSSSSKRAASLFSTKSTYTAGDITMSDGQDEFRMEDFVKDDDEESVHERGDGTINPSTIEIPFQFGANSSTQMRESASTSNSPGPFGMDSRRPTPEASLSPNEAASMFSSPCAPREARGHTKVHSQYSLTRSMKDLKTKGSRETSPWHDTSGLPNLDHSHNPAASEFFHPVPLNTNVDFGFGATNGQNGHPTWSQSFNLNHNSMPQNSSNAIAFHMPGDSPTPIPFSFQQPIGPGPYRLTIDGGTAKSRVETQIRMKLILFPLPPGVRRLHLPPHTISKPKLLIIPTPPRSADMLELHTALVCTSAMQDEALKQKALQRARAAAQSMKLAPLPDANAGDEETDGQNGAEVHICNGCMIRERKRASRKKIKNVEDEALWMRDEDRRIVVFNSQEIRDWSQRQEGDGFSVDVQMRIACYCRHHAEKQGFQVIFTITDYRGAFVAQSMSSSIMITDDHKAHSQPSGTAGALSNSPDNTNTLPLSNTIQDMNSLNPPGLPFGMSHSNSDIQTLASNVGRYPLTTAIAPAGPTQPPSMVPNARLLSRPASPTMPTGPSSKKRKASGSMKVPTSLSMTRLDTSPSAVSPPRQESTVQTTSTTSPSPYSPAGPSFASASDPSFGQSGLAMGPISQPFSNGPPTPSGNDQVSFASGIQPTNYDSSNMHNTTQMYSAPTSTHPSRAPSPGILRNGNPNGLQYQSNQFSHAQAVASSLYRNIPLGMNAAPSPPSVIHKIIPAEGPKSGGIEVTILGSGFHQGLEVMFGDVRATTTTYWGESSLVCLLPPSPHASTVLVSLKHPSSPAAQQFSAKQQPVFKYMDDDEQQLMRTALTVLGHKMSGNVQDIGDIARRIIGDGLNPSWGQPSAAPNGQRGGGPPSNYYSFDTQIETQLLKVLELIDLDDSPHKPRLNLRRTTGQTMLHLACSLGLQRFVAGLLARCANPDVRDKGGYTPLHMAALNDRLEIVRRLIIAGADPTIRTLSGLTVLDVARSREVREVVRALYREERHARSRSGGSLPSRTSSLTSLKSLWEPTSASKQADLDRTTSEEAETGEESPEYSGEESPEYSSENLVSEDDPDADDGPWWLESRRPSTIPLPSRRSSLDTGLQPPRPGVGGGIQSPTTAVTALRDQFTAQFHQLQQAIFSQIPGHLPQMLQLRTLPPLAEYQAYLTSAAVLQRLTSMVGNIGGSRPGSADESPSAQELGAKSWDIASLIQGPALPPAYDEIYPQGDLDEKQASAAQAAAEAEADQKCTTLYDQPSTLRTSGETSGRHAHILAAPVCDRPVMEPLSDVDAPSGTTGMSKTAGKGSRRGEKTLPALLQIGRKNAITKEQQETLQRARAEQLKRLSGDRNLFFIWIPLLLIVICAMLYNAFPRLFTVLLSFLVNNTTAGVATSPTSNQLDGRFIEVT